MFTLLCIIACIVSAGSKESGTGGSSNSGGSTGSVNEMSQLSVIYSLTEICSQELIMNGEGFFFKWISQSLIQDDFQSLETTHNIKNNDFDNHVKVITNYIEVFKTKKQLMNKMIVLKFIVKMESFITLIKKTANLPSDDPFEGSNAGKNIKAFLGVDLPNTEEFLRGIRERRLNENLIFTFHKFFNQHGTYSSIVDLKQNGMEKAISDINNKLINLLYSLLGFAEGGLKAVEFLKLGTENQDILQTFYNTFHYVLDKTTLKTKIMGKKHNNIVILRDNHKFFVPGLFKKIGTVTSSFKSNFGKDESLTIYDPEIKLLLFHQLGPHAEFNWPKFKIFDKPTFSDIDNTDTDLAGKKKRKYIFTYIAIYKVYSIARFLDLFKGEFDTVEKVAQVLFDWILEAKEYQPSTPQKSSGKSESDQDVILDQYKQIKELLPDNEFANSFMPMLVELCTLIPGCNLDTHAKKEIIIIRFKILAYFNDLFKSNILFDFPPGIRATIQTDKVIDQTTGFLKGLKLEENTIKIGSILEDPFGGRITPIQIVTSKKVLKKKTAIKGGKFEFVLRKPSWKSLEGVAGIDKEFNNSFGSKLTTNEGGTVKIVEPLIDTYLNTVEMTESTKKKSLGITLLIRFIMKLKDEALKKVIILKVIKSQTEKIRKSVDHTSVQGLRNFLMYTLTSNQRYIPYKLEERFSRNMDIAFIIFVFTQDKLLFWKEQKNADKVSKYTELFKMYTNLVLKRSTSNLNSLGQDDIEAVKTMIKGIVKKGETNDQINAYFLEKLKGFKMLYDLRGFFDYYAAVDESQVQNGFVVKHLPFVDFHRIYTQFYAFLIHVRNNVILETEDSHRFVLNQLEQCLYMTQITEKFIRPSEEDPVCKFSHRKYAEILFFYKAYLINTKALSIPLDSNLPDQFNVHTRSFLGFTISYSPYKNVLYTECTATPTYPICVSQSIFETTIRYISDKDAKDEIVFNEISRISSTGTSGTTKLNILNGLESAFMVAKKSNPVSYSKLEFLLQSSYGNESTLKKALTFKNEEADYLTEYLIRTYKKLEVTESDDNLSRVIQSILISGGSDAKSFGEVLQHYFLYKNVFFSSYLKLFLQYTVKDEHFAIFAQLMIVYKVSVELIKMNDMESDGFFLEFGPLMKNLDGNTPADLIEGSSKIRQKLINRYEDILKLTESMASNSIKETFDDVDDFLDELLNDDDKSKKSETEKSEASFKNSQSSIKSVSDGDVYASVKETSNQLDIKINSAQSSLEESFIVEQSKKQTYKDYVVEITVEEIYTEEEGGLINKTVKVGDPTFKKMERSNISNNSGNEQTIPADVAAVALNGLNRKVEELKAQFLSRKSSTNKSSSENWEEDSGNQKTYVNLKTLSRRSRSSRSSKSSGGSGKMLRDLEMEEQKPKFFKSAVMSLV